MLATISTFKKAETVKRVKNSFIIENKRNKRQSKITETDNFMVVEMQSAATSQCCSRAEDFQYGFQVLPLR